MTFEPRDRFLALCARIGRVAPDAFNALATAYQHPERAYHNLGHIVACLEELDHARDGCDDPDAVEAAIWFHDAVYDARRADNEQRSAELASRVLSDCGASPALCDRVERLILVTRQDCVPETRDGRLIADIDLSILGKPLEVFHAYEHAIREEYRHVSDADFRAGRAKVLRSFLERDRIYATDIFRDRYEAAARANLRRSIDRLLKRPAD